MKRENPLPLFFLLATLFILSSVSRAQSDSATENKLAEEVERIEAKVQFGPHYKNRNAAGRLLALNRATPALPTRYTPQQHFGPAYKSRRTVIIPNGAVVPRGPSKPRLTGPRYKNRRLKFAKPLRHAIFKR